MVIHPTGSRRVIIEGVGDKGIGAAVIGVRGDLLVLTLLLLLLGAPGKGVIGTVGVARDPAHRNIGEIVLHVGDMMMAGILYAPKRIRSHRWSG